MDVPVQQLDGRVEGVIGAVLISLRDEGSHNIREKAAVIPNISAVDVVSLRIRLKTFFPAEQKVSRSVSANLLSDSVVNPSPSALRKFV